MLLGAFTTISIGESIDGLSGTIPDVVLVEGKNDDALCRCALLVGTAGVLGVLLLPVLCLQSEEYSRQRPQRRLTRHQGRQKRR